MTAQPVEAYGRLVALDVFRGATIIGMIVVNNPGSWATVYPPLLHAPWHGWTPTDLVFPFFLFIVGVAVVLAYEKRMEAGASRGALLQKAFVRAAILFGLGLLMAAWPIVRLNPEFGLRPELATLRIMGVLQRIALCYLVVAALVLYTRPKIQVAVGAALLFGYWAAMTLVPVPGYGAGALGAPEGTLAAHIDRVVFGDHLWVGANREWDPEGLLSTLPAIGTTLFGVWTGRLILAARPEPRTLVARMLVRGVGLVIAGYVWSWFFPINKPIWTSSYAVFTAGQAMCALGVCVWVFDVLRKDTWARPFVVYGVNAITVFVMSGIVAKQLIVTRVGETSLQGWIFQNVFAPLASPVNASLLYALCWVTAWGVVLSLMYRRGVIIKV